MATRRLAAFGAALTTLLLVGLVLWQSGVFSPTPAFAFDTTLSILKGQLLIQPGGGGGFVPGRDGQTLKVGDRVRTEANSYAVITFFDGSTIELEPSTDISLEELQKPTAQRPGFAIRLTQWLGVSWSRVERLAEPAARYEIETPSAVVLVRDTLVETRVEPDKTTLVKNVEGRVTVAAQQAEVDVPAGQETRVDPGQPPAPPVPSPPPTNRLRIVMQSPVWTLIVDPLGRSAGTTDPGIDVNQIPGATVSVPFLEPAMVVIPDLIDGQYLIVLEGKGQGAFRLVVQGFSDQDQFFSQETGGDVRSEQWLLATLDVTYQDGRLVGMTLGSLVVLTGEEPGKVVKMVRLGPSLNLFGKRYKVEGDAMAPALTPGKTYVAYKKSAYRRGDVIVFEHVKDTQKVDFVKRIMGLPRETVEIKGGKVFINGQVLEEPYILEPMNYTIAPVIVPEGHFYVLGDNRNKSVDWGPVPLDRIRGAINP